MPIPACEVVLTALWTVHRALQPVKHWNTDRFLMSEEPDVCEQALVDLKALWRFGYGTLRSLLEFAETITKFDMPLGADMQSGFADGIIRFLKEKHAFRVKQARMARAAAYALTEEDPSSVKQDARSMLEEARQIRHLGHHFQRKEIHWEAIRENRVNAYDVPIDDRAGEVPSEKRDSSSPGQRHPSHTTFVDGFSFACHPVEETFGRTTDLLCEATDIFTMLLSRSAASGDVSFEQRDAFNKLWGHGIEVLRQTSEVALLDMADFLQDSGTDLELEVIQYLLAFTKAYRTFRQMIESSLRSTCTAVSRAMEQPGGKVVRAKTLDELNQMARELRECQAMRQDGRKPRIKRISL